MQHNNDLWNMFLSHTTKGMVKLVHYFPIYERHFRKFVNQHIVFWEIGVLNGGSLELWRKYFGPFATIVGIDINPACKAHEDPKMNTHVRVGSQSDPKFLLDVIKEFGPPSVVLDDGSHKQYDVRMSFECIYPYVLDNGVYMVEDMGTAYWDQFDGGLLRKESFIEQCKKYIDSLNGYAISHPRNTGYKPEEFPDDFTKQTFSVCFYEAVVVFEKMFRNQFFPTRSVPTKQPRNSEKA